MRASETAAEAIETLIRKWRRCSITSHYYSFHVHVTMLELECEMSWMCQLLTGKHFSSNYFYYMVNALTVCFELQVDTVNVVDYVFCKTAT